MKKPNSSQSSIESKQKDGIKLTPKSVIGMAVILILLPLILFVASGKIDWWEAWVMAIIVDASMIISRLIIITKHPDLAIERANYGKGAGVKSWDRVIMPINSVLGILIWVSAGLDKRFAASPKLPLWLELGAFALLIGGYFVSSWALIVNRFFSADARIQSDRGQYVIENGPYRIVRHPGYAGGMLVYLMMPLALGALWAFIPVVLSTILTGMRTLLEDRMLQAELPGYTEYTKKTKYRLFPGLW